MNIPAKVTKVRGHNAFVQPVNPTTAPAEIAKGDWFRVLCVQVGDVGHLIPPSPGARCQFWLFAPTKLNEGYL